MGYLINATQDYMSWFELQNDDVKLEVHKVVAILQEVGPALRRPRSGTITGSKYQNMKELIIQAGGLPYRVFYRFCPDRTGLLLTGGCKDGLGDKVFYRKMIPIADRIMDEHT